MKMTLEKLAEITKTGFDEVREVQEITNTRLTSLEEGQETILLRLDHHAYKMDVEDLKRRVTRLEEGEGI